MVPTPAGVFWLELAFCEDKAEEGAADDAEADDADALRLSCKKYFCACDRTCDTVLVPTTTEISSATPGPRPTVTFPLFSGLSF